MKRTTIALLCGALTIAGCSSSEQEPASNIVPAAEDSTLGSISVGTGTAPILDPLPDIQFDETTSTLNSNESIATTSVLDDGSASSDASASITGTVDGGRADGGSGDGGASDAGSAPASGDTDSGRGESDETSGSSAISLDSEATTPSDIYQPEQFQAGTLTAADYDDQLNPHLYQRYASDYLQRVGGKLDVPYIDLSKRIALRVRDLAGNNYGGVTLAFSDGSNEILTLTTPASGKTYLYSDIDSLPETFNIRATGLLGTAIDQTISLSNAQTSGVINITMPEDNTPAFTNQVDPILDVMFVIDTTGSMGDELNYLKTELTPIINAIPYPRSLVNVGLTFYRDLGDEYVVRSHGFTNDTGRAQQTLNNESYDGGGDYPEAMDQALHQAIDANWQPDSKRILFLIADAPPHNDKMRATWNAAEQARKKNIHIVPIAASGVAEDAEYLMRSMAAFTNSRYLFLTDDSGFGNPHAEPDIDCYVVTHLDNLMIRVLNSLITGVRDEPTANDIIRQVGNYNNGVCAVQ